jgi:hypothetical protein
MAIRTYYRQQNQSRPHGEDMAELDRFIQFGVIPVRRAYSESPVAKVLAILQTLKPSDAADDQQAADNEKVVAA